jgi:glycine/D-amino acid oxidase-like deaminating enzyme
MDGPPPGLARHGADPVGQAKTKGVFYATGHGHLGLTYAATTRG